MRISLIAKWTKESLLITIELGCYLSTEHLEITAKHKPIKIQYIMKQLTISALLCFFAFTAKSQEYIAPTSSLFEGEYEIVSSCQQGYEMEIQAFQISNLLNDVVYEFIIDSTLTDFDDISFLPYSQDWELESTNASGYVQEWRWEGDDDESDYIYVDLYIDDYDDVEVGLTESVFIWASYAVYPYPIQSDHAVTTAEIVTSSWVDGSFLDCTNPVQFELEDLASTGSATWVIKQGSTTKASGSGVNASASNITQGAGEVVYTIDFSCTLESIEIKKDFWFGKFDGGVQVSGQAAVCPSSLYVYTANPPGGHSGSYSYSWTYPSNWTKYSQWDNCVQLYTPSSPNYGTVRVAVTNSCGTSTYSGMTVYPGYCGGYYIASPNPSSDYVEVDIKADRISLKEASSENDIVLRMVDKMGTVKHIAEFKGKDFPYRINTSTLPKGNYVVNIINGKYTESLQIVVAR